MAAADVFFETENEAEIRTGRWKPPSRILGVLASPRGFKGATGRVYERFVVGAESAGATVDSLVLGEWALQPCRGCFRCWVRGGRSCVIDDAMTPFVDTVPARDLLVLATPVYMDGMSGLLKNFLDRLMPLDHPAIGMDGGRCIHPCRHRRMPNLVLLAVCGFFELESFGPLVDHVRAVARNMHMPLLASLLRPETLSFRQPDTAVGLEEVLCAFEEAGARLVREGTVPRALLTRIQAPLLEREEYLAHARSWWE